MASNKKLLLGIFGIIFLASSFWLVQSAPNAEAAQYLGCAIQPGNPSNCAWFPQDLSAILCESTSWCMVNPSVGDTLVHSQAVSNCDDGVSKYCAENGCPSSGNDGDPCGVAVGKGGIGSCNTNPQATGVWDASDQKCIQCSGQKEDKVCGTTGSVDPSCSLASDGLYESACGAPCDELAACGGGCTAAAPTLTVSPGSYSGPASTQTFTLSVTRKDSAGCGINTIQLDASCTAGNSPAWNSMPTASLNPGDSDTKTNDVTITANGSCTFTATSPDGANPSTSQTVTIAISGLSVIASPNSVTIGTPEDIDFMVKDAAGSPVVGATVSLSGGATGTCTTGGGGFCTILGVNATADITVTADDGGGNTGGTTITATGGGFCNNNGTCEPGLGETIGGCADCSAGPVSASFCESSLVAADVGKLCGAYTVTAADVAANGWCCANVNFVAADEPTCQASDPGCASGGPVCGDNTDGICPGGCTNPPDTDCPPGPPPPSCGGPGMYRSPITYCTIQELLAAATGWILGLVSSIIILILVIGGLMYVTSTGDEEKMRTAKNIILYAIIGLGIILISYALILEVKTILKIP